MFLALTPLNHIRKMDGRDKANARDETTGQDYIHTRNKQDTDKRETENEHENRSWGLDFIITTSTSDRECV